MPLTEQMNAVSIFFFVFPHWCLFGIMPFIESGWHWLLKSQPLSGHQSDVCTRMLLTISISWIVFVRDLAGPNMEQKYIEIYFKNPEKSFLWCRIINTGTAERRKSTHHFRVFIWVNHTDIKVLRLRRACWRGVLGADKYVFQHLTYVTKSCQDPSTSFLFFSSEQQAFENHMWKSSKLAPLWFLLSLDI